VNGLLNQQKNLLSNLFHGQGVLILQPAVNQSRICELITLNSLAVIHVIVYALSCAHITVPNACLDDASVNNETWLHTQLFHLFKNSQGSLEVTCFPIYLDQDTKCNIAGLDFLSDHISIDHKTNINESNPTAAI